MGEARPIRRWLLCAALGAASVLARPAAAADARIPARGSCQGCNLVLVSLDTLRPDRLEPYGYARPTSPVFAALAERGLLFEQAWSASAATAEAHMSLFTSLHPSVHGVATVGRGERWTAALAAGIPTFTRVLHEAGYATGGFHDGGHLAAELGFDDAFDHYEHASFMQSSGWGRAQVWLRERTRPPTFLFLHTYHVHDPYTPQPATRERFAEGRGAGIESDAGALLARAQRRCAREADGCENVWKEAHRLFWDGVDVHDPQAIRYVSSLYDAEIHEVDQGLMRILAAVKRLPGDTLLVILSDHGEAFMEHGHTSHGTLYEEVTRVPLLVLHPRAPELAGQRASARLSLVDVAPTLLDWLGLARPKAFQGRSLAGSPLQPDAPAPILTEYRGDVALLRGSKKLLLEHGTGEATEPLRRLLERAARAAQLPDALAFTRAQLFDLARDPHEQRDLGPADPDFEPMLRELLARIAANRAHRERLAHDDAPASLSDDTRRQLEALGYLD